MICVIFTKCKKKKTNNHKILTNAYNKFQVVTRTAQALERGQGERRERTGSILAGDRKQASKSNMDATLLDDFESGY